MRALNTMCRTGRWACRPRTANNNTVAMGLPTPKTMCLREAAPMTAPPTAQR